MSVTSENKIEIAKDHVIYAWNYRQWGGVQIYFLSLIKEVRRHYRVTAVIPEDSDPLIVNALKKLGVQVEFTRPAPDTHIRNRVIDRIRVRYRNMTSENRMVNTILRLSSKSDTIVQIKMIERTVMSRTLSSLIDRSLRRTLVHSEQ